MDAVEEPIVGTVTAQNGSSTTCNGWVASAVLGTLVIDAAGDGRAHPTGKMGSFGLAADDDYQTVQAVAGGNRAAGRYLEVVTRGTVRHTANVLRTASHESGGFIAARATRCRRRSSPPTPRSARSSFALELGEAMLAAEERGGAQARDRRRRRPSRRQRSSPAAPCARRSCAPRTRSTSARSPSASSSWASSTST